MAEASKSDNVLTDEYIPFTIDLWHRYGDAGLWARDLWQELFKRLNCVSWNSLDNLLIDLTYFEKYLRSGEAFYWEHLGDSGTTKIFSKEYFEPCLRSLDDVYLIEFVKDNHKGERFIRVTKQRFAD